MNIIHIASMRQFVYRRLIFVTFYVSDSSSSSSSASSSRSRLVVVHGYFRLVSVLAGVANL